MTRSTWPLWDCLSADEQAAIHKRYPGAVPRRRPPVKKPENLQPEEELNKDTDRLMRQRPGLLGQQKGDPL